jgi:two-component system nitrogen regulation response regulator NtrX
LQDEGYTVTMAEMPKKQLGCVIKPAPPWFTRYLDAGLRWYYLIKRMGKKRTIEYARGDDERHASIDTAVEATKIGALDFLEKPIALQKLLSSVDRALKYGEMQAASGLSLDKLGNSPVIQELNQHLERLTKHNMPVLLTGEAGSPFELIARYLHKNGTHGLSQAK